jgi:hypothetical protein
LAAVGIGIPHQGALRQACPKFPLGLIELAPLRALWRKESVHRHTNQESLRPKLLQAEAIPTDANTKSA